MAIFALNSKNQFRGPVISEGEVFTPAGVEG